MSATAIRVDTWKCVNCGRTLGQIVAGVIVIRASAHRLIRASGWVEQTCPRCNASNRRHVA